MLNAAREILELLVAIAADQRERLLVGEDEGAVEHVEGDVLPVSVGHDLGVADRAALGHASRAGIPAEGT